MPTTLVARRTLCFDDHFLPDQRDFSTYREAHIGQVVGIAYGFAKKADTGKILPTGGIDYWIKDSLGPASSRFRALAKDQLQQASISLASMLDDTRLPVIAEAAFLKMQGPQTGHYSVNLICVRDGVIAMRSPWMIIEDDGKGLKFFVERSFDVYLHRGSSAHAELRLLEDARLFIEAMIERNARQTGGSTMMPELSVWGVLPIEIRLEP